MAGEDGREFLATPLGVHRAVLEWVLVDKPIEVLFQRAGNFGRAARAGTIR